MKMLRLLPFILIVVAWWAASDVMHLVPTIMLPAPSSVLQVIFDEAGSGNFLPAVTGSLSRFLLGLIIGVAAGAPLGIWLGVTKTAAAAVLPFLKFFQSIAGVTWIPLAVLWFGISTEAAVFIIVNTTFFIVLYAVVTGVRTIPQSIFDAVRTLGGKRVAILWQVLIPGSLPHVLTGMRIAVGYGWRTLIAAEIIASGRGLGVMIWEGQQQLDTAKVFAALLMIGIVSFSMDRFVIQPLERATIQKWGMATKIT